MPNNQPSSTHNQQEFSVSEISNLLKRTVEDAFSYVRVRGEISGLKKPGSGHIYLNLKDEDSVINGIIWKWSSKKLAIDLEDGMEVICTGKISTYPNRSNYQLIIENIEIAGEGALMALLEKRKKTLMAEGLFAQENKKPIPFLPQVIGVVTSPTGAVIKDILHRISDRFPVNVIVWPVLVQGEGAKEQIRDAIEGFNKISNDDAIKRPDLIIVARGGGSLEDLWAFNEEVVVRAAAMSDIPLISAVGHETDTTLIDYASDKRAPTPTAAAEMAVPVKDELMLTLLEIEKRILQSSQRLIEDKKSYIAAISKGLLNPTQLIQNASQRLDDWDERLSLALPTYIKNKSSQLDLLVSKLNPSQLVNNVKNKINKMNNVSINFINSYEKLLNNYYINYSNISSRLTVKLVENDMNLKEQKLDTQVKLLESYHYKKVLDRGYALVWSEDNKIIQKADKLKNAMPVTIEFADGKANAMIANKNVVKTPSKKKSSIDDEGQESLF